MQRKKKNEEENQTLKKSKTIYNQNYVYKLNGFTNEISQFNILLMFKILAQLQKKNLDN